MEESYKGRASRVNPDTTFGLASLNLTSVKEEDQGWYECKVFYLDRTGATDNGTWIHLDVHGRSTPPPAHPLRLCYLCLHLLPLVVLVYSFLSPVVAYL